MSDIFHRIRCALVHPEIEVSLGPPRRVDGAAVVGVDFSGDHAVAGYADACLTCVEPREVLAVARHVRDRRCAPTEWLIAGVASLPGTPQRAAAFVVELARCGGQRVCVDDRCLGERARRRLIAYLRRSAADARRRGLSPRVRVLCSGHTLAA